MPTYEYACKACGHRFEIEQSFHEDSLTDCPECAGNLRKVFSAAGIIFKGSGWHVKDYAGSSSTPASSGTSTEPAKPATTDTASSSDTSAAANEPAKAS